MQMHFQLSLLIIFISCSSLLSAQDTLLLAGHDNEKIQQIGSTSIWADYGESFLQPSAQNPNLLIDMVSQGFLLLEEKPAALSDYETRIRSLTRYKDTLLNLPVKVADFKGKILKGTTGKGAAAEVFWLMYFGNESRVFDLKGGYLKSADANLSDEILYILKSIRWLPPDIFEGLPYSLQADSLGFAVEKSGIPKAVLVFKNTTADSLDGTIFYSKGEALFRLELSPDAENWKAVNLKDGLKLSYQVFTTKKEGQSIPMFEGNVRKGDQEIGIIVSGANKEVLEREIIALLQTLRFK